jgi:hypothetical protein
MATGRVPTTANSPLTAKGDLFGYSTTQARVAVGNNGETLVADSSTSTGLRYQPNFSAGKNAIINGAMNVWQRGTTFNAIANQSFVADRFSWFYDGTATWNCSQQTFTPGTAPVAGYEGSFFMRASLSANTSSTYGNFIQKIEDVRTFAGQNVTISFWAKADSARTSLFYLFQNFGSGGSSTVVVTTPSITYTTSWARYTFTIGLPSLASKTIGTNNYLELGIRTTATTGSTLDIWGVQLEASNTATAFQTATGTIQGELAACQRYYYRTTSALNTFTPMYPQIFAYSATNAVGTARLPQRMRTKPSAIDFSSVTANEITSGGSVGVATISLGQGGDDFQELLFTGLSGMTIYRPYAVLANNTTSAFLGLSAEL